MYYYRVAFYNLTCGSWFLSPAILDAISAGTAHAYMTGNGLGLLYSASPIEAPECFDSLSLEEAQEIVEVSHPYCVADVQFVADNTRPDYGTVVNLKPVGAGRWGTRDAEFPLAIVTLVIGHETCAQAHDNQLEIIDGDVVLKPEEAWHSSQPSGRQ